ncbi:hypothetical protein AQ490_15955 [Wenjunlia vitaminophila]|uniref:DUF2267 domain-containing protein n=1 Tax=Wenjunlia vitaminophila TaxID=76728 RepID=A0A0T6LX23_WENVI|nr:DUF2267 domain-containing protein [Wenjunlia vitaminophila]KRV50560.1 hypothetical protein AQ490_15955 [Wenjunlia vitaminophila]
MKYGEIVAAVRDRDEYAADEAGRITEAVVATLGRRLTPASAEHLADQLPPELAEALNQAEAAPQNWGVTEFIHHVAEATGDDERIADMHARAVLSVLGEDVSGGEVNKLISQLPSGFAQYFGWPD